MADKNNLTLQSKFLVMSSLSSVTSKKYFQKTRRGKVLQVVREKYLRSDLGFGTTCNPSSGLSRLLTEEDVLTTLRDEDNSFPYLLVLDTNIVLNQLDALESSSACVANLVLCSTVLSETQKRNRSYFKRLLALINQPNRTTIVFPNENHSDTFESKKMGESDNDYNDRLVRNVATYFSTRIRNCTVLFITDDKKSLQLVEPPVVGMSMHQFAQSVSKRFPTFSDFVSSSSSSSAVVVGAGTDVVVYSPHLSLDVLERGLKSFKYFQGTFRSQGNRQISGSASGSAMIVLKNGNPLRVHFPNELAMNRAIDGDRVAVLCTPPREGEEGVITVGQVVGILKRNWRACAGTLVQEEEGGVFFFLPLDAKFPKLVVSTSQFELLQHQRVVVQMDGWQERTLPTGHFIKSLGLIGSKDAETSCTLFEYDIPTQDFSQAVLQCLPPPDFKPDPTNRVDLRDVEQICSVDPPNCKDIDDALHARIVNQEYIEVGVHIADVSHFVLPESAMDVEAKNRGTSTYLVEQRLDMLPSLLTTNLCSLVGNQDRLCFSVIFKLNLEGSEFIEKPRFCKSIIRSRGALTYAQAFDYIEHPDLTRNNKQAESIRLLNQVAYKLRQKRIDLGAINLASQEMKFELGEEDEEAPMGMKEYARTDSHLMVEEYMLLANCAVAERLEQVFPKRALLRRHPKPNPEFMEKLVNTAKAAGVYLNGTTSKSLADSLNAAMKPDQPFFNQLLRIMTTRAMQQANYFCTGDFDSKSDYQHYGLAVPVYTHFTSPIRRYADLVVHRLLAAAEGLEPLFQGYEKVAEMRAIADNLNRRHRNAQRAGRASAQIHSVLFFKAAHGGRVDKCEAYVYSVSDTTVGVIIPEFGLEQDLTLQDKFSFDDKTFSIEFAESKQRIRIFDRILVNIVVKCVGLDQRQSLVVEYSPSPPPVVETKAKKVKRQKLGA